MKPTLVRTFLIAAAYGVLAKYSQIFVGPDVSAFFWPPSGFMLGVLLWRPRREWPLLMPAFFIANAVANAIDGDRLSISLGFGFANCVESLAAAWLLTRFLGASLTMGKLREVIGLITLATLVSNAFTAMLGAAVATLGFGAPFWSAWRVWWIADSVGMLLVTPVIVSWAASGRPGLKSLSRPRILEAGVLSQSAPALARIQDKLKRSINHAGRLGGQIQQLLDVSRIQMGKLELQLEMVDLGKVVEEVAGRFMEQAAQAGCSLKVAPPPQPVMGYWDPLQLDRVTTNLISNAVKYGAGKPVEIAVTADSERASLSVKDQGIGTSPADQKRIFQRFVRAVSQRHYGGLGLGLWITRQALEAMGGSIRVQSTPSVETVFVAELPLHPVGPA